MTERKYQMVKLSKGDYLLASNDRTMLWRIYTYQEDGSLVDVERPVVGQFWACARRPMPRFTKPNQPLDEWEGWEFWAGPLRTRREAIEEALR